MLANRSRYGDIIKPIVKMVISLIVLGIVSSILLDILAFRSITPGSPFTMGAVASLYMGLVMIAVVLFFGKELSSNVKSAFPSYRELSPLSTV